MTSFLWYIPNQTEPGHRGDTVSAGHNSLDTLTDQAAALERFGWQGALIGTGWGRPDTLTVATALAARTESFEPLAAIRPGYWSPAHFASAAATLDHLSGGRLRINIVSGSDDLAAYGDREVDRATRYQRTEEFLALVRRLWTESGVTFTGRHFQVTDSTITPVIQQRPGRPHPPLYFGGASPEAERVAAAQADVQLFWGEPRADLVERIARLRALSDQVGRELPPLEFGLRITTVVRETSGQAWDHARQRVARMAESWRDVQRDQWRGAVGQQRLLELADRGEVVDENLYTAPGRHGAAGAGTTWLVGSAEEVVESLVRYAELGISHFILSDTPYLAEIERQGSTLLPLLRERLGESTSTPVEAVTGH